MSLAVIFRFIDPCAALASLPQAGYSYTAPPFNNEYIRLRSGILASTSHPIFNFHILGKTCLPIRQHLELLLVPLSKSSEFSSLVTLSRARCGVSWHFKCKFISRSNDEIRIASRFMTLQICLLHEVFNSVLEQSE